MPTRKPRVPKTADDKEQSERFIETAREVDADEIGKELEKAFKKLAPSSQKSRRKAGNS